MSHLDFVRPNGIWTNEMVPGASDYQRFDVGQSKGINFDTGGSWAPTSPIGIGGTAGLSFTTAATQFTGGVSTQTGGRLHLDAGFGNNQPTLVSPASRTIVLPALDLLPGSSGGALPPSFFVDDVMTVSDSPVGVQLALGSGQLAFLSIPGRYVHEGSTFSKLRLHFRVPTKPTTNVIPSLAYSLLGYNAVTQAYQPLQPISGVSGLSIGSLVGWQAWQATNTWTANTTEQIGNRIVVNVSGTNYYFFVLSVTGSDQTGSSPPATWNTTVGSTTSDNGVLWQCLGTTDFALGSYVIPNGGNPLGTSNGYYYKATAIGTAGQSGTVEPNWPLIIGNTVVDNQITWTCFGYAGSVSQTIDAATYYNNGRPQVLELDFDNTTSALQTDNTVNPESYTYVLTFGALQSAIAGGPPTLNAMLHAVELVFSNINDIRFE